ncbi:hypothetical protein F4778DRAFT_345799 [Xylariomycetidae sp. FL2044]|nr:hypothetical protein F4778DRAFT_345799 [Xylariomycetidae sp. FL2044]
MAAVPPSLSSLLDTLTQSLNSATEATPKIAGIESTTGGVSLLDVKNELLLSYLQNLVFLILLKIRNAKHQDNSGNSSPAENSNELPDTVVRKLVELRLYLDKGVRPLEEKLRFQLDKILRAADDADREEKAAAEAKQNAANSDSGSDSSSGSGSDDDHDSDDDASVDGSKQSKPRKQTLSDKQYVPGISGFAEAVAPVGMAAAQKDKTGVYRPPKITPMAMPTTDGAGRERNNRERRPLKSATMDEYISNELSAVPVAQPSVGTTIVSGGRKVKTAAERDLEDRRREYEETNFVRLPKESKKDRAARARAEGGRANGRMTFGGEDWRDLGEGVDRINRLTSRKSGGGGGGGGGGTKALLEKSRKRGRETTDSARGSGFSAGTREIGDHYSKRLKVMEGGRRDRGKKR